MKTFKQYLNENEWKKNGKDFVHSTRMGSDNVDVLYNRKTGPKKDYDVNFYVNGSPLKNNNMKSKNGVGILRHVHSSIKSFINDSKPNSMTFTSFDSKKHDVYTKLSKKIAKKHNATHIEYTNSNKIILEESKMKTFKQYLNEAYMLRFERDKKANMAVLHVKNTKTRGRTEIRGKLGYETNGYDPKDRLHKVLDKIGKASSISDLMNGDEVPVNPKHPKGPLAIRILKKIDGAK